MLNFERLLELDVLDLVDEDEDERIYNIKDNIILVGELDWPIESFRWDKDTNVITVSNNFCDDDSFDFEIEPTESFIVKVKKIQVIEELLT